METSTVRILVVEGFAGFRSYINSLLEGQPEFHVIGTASDGLEAVVKAQQLRPDLVLMDIGLPTIDGLETARRIRECLPFFHHIGIGFLREEDVIPLEATRAKQTQTEPPLLFALAWFKEETSRKNGTCCEIWQLQLVMFCSAMSPPEKAGGGLEQAAPL